MSYSYIKTVFPEFEYKSKHENLYNSLNNETQSLPFKHPVQENDYNYKDNTVNYPVINNSSSFENIVLEDNTKSIPVTFQKELKEGFDQTSSIKQEELYNYNHNNANDRQNQQKGNMWYNEPINPDNYKIETYRNDDLICKEYTNHVKNCEKCTSMLKMHMHNNINEIWDIASYILFAIFIVILLKML